MERRLLDSHLLTRCLRSGLGDDLDFELCRIDGESWRRLVDQAVWHGVAPLLYHRLRRSVGLEIPAEPFEKLRDLYLHCLLRNEAISEQLLEIVRETTRSGSPVLILKGAYLSQCVYEEAALRPMGDIDLLARPHDAEKVLRLLEALGYQSAPGTDAIDYSRLYHLRPVSRAESVAVEIHHDLAPHWAPFEHDIDGLWNRSIRTRVDDLDIHHPAPDDLLLHLCTHAAYNDEFRLGVTAVCDVDAVVRKLGSTLDWARLAQTANSDGRSHFAYATLRLSQDLLETPISEDVLVSLLHCEIDEKVVTEAVGYVLSTTGEVPSTVQSVGEAVTPRVQASALIRVSVTGPVGRPGFYALSTDLRLSDVVALAGGATSGADPSRMQIERGQRVLWSREELTSPVADGRTLGDVGVQAGDRIVVEAGGGPGFAAGVQSQFVQQGFRVLSFMMLGGLMGSAIR